MTKMEKGRYPHPMLLLELIPENEEVFEKTLKHLHDKGWTFGKGESLLKFELCKDDDRIFMYNDKTIRIGNFVSSRFCKPRFTIRVNKEEIIKEYEIWVKDFAREVEKRILEEVTAYGKASF